MFGFFSVGVWSCWISCLNIRTMDLKCHVFWMDSGPFRSEWSRADSVFMRLFCGGWTEDGSAAVLWSFRRVFVCSSSFNVQFVVKPYRPDDISCSSTASWCLPQHSSVFSTLCTVFTAAVRWTCILPGRTWTSLLQSSGWKQDSANHRRSDALTFKIQTVLILCSS